MSYSQNQGNKRKPQDKVTKADESHDSLVWTAKIQIIQWIIVINLMKHKEHVLLILGDYILPKCSFIVSAL